MSNIQHLWPNPTLPSRSVSVSPSSSLSLLISSPLSPSPHHSIPPHFIVRWGFARQKVTEMSLTYTQSPSLGLSPFFPPHPFCSLSYENAYIIKCLFFFVPLFLFPSRLSPSLSISLPSSEYSTYIILFGQTPCAPDLIQEVTDFGL